MSKIVQFLLMLFVLLAIPVFAEQKKVRTFLDASQQQKIVTSLNNNLRGRATACPDYAMLVVWLPDQAIVLFTETGLRFTYWYDGSLSLQQAEISLGPLSNKDIEKFIQVLHYHEKFWNDNLKTNPLPTVADPRFTVPNVATHTQEWKKYLEGKRTYLIGPFRFLIPPTPQPPATLI